MTLESLAEQLKVGDISITEWQAQMRDFIRLELNTAMELAKGGREFVSPADWGFVGSQAKEQYANLDNFVADIQADPVKWLNGRSLNQRVGLYGQLGYAALENDIAREHEKQGFTEEFNVLEASAAHCRDCQDEHDKGWVPIGTLSKIGTRKCVTNDRCSIIYRKPDGAGGWIKGDE